MPLEFALQPSGLELSAWDEPPTTYLQVKTKVGLEGLPNQIVRLKSKTGYFFNIMVAGESGLGKSTFLNTLFGESLLSSEDLTLEQRRTDIVRSKTFVLSESNVDVKMTLIDTPGFGVQINRNTGIQPVVNYVEQQLNAYLEMEERESFRSINTDPRVHVCLYFIAPSGHSLTELDVTAMKALCNVVNLIPVIGKSDTLTKEELISFRHRLLKQIRDAEISIYPFSVSYLEEPSLSELEKFVPFAVVGSNTILKTNDGRSVRARQYRWGIVEVENPEHSDFIQLRDLLIRTHLNDLIETTHNVHYEKFRSHKLESQGRADALLQSDKDFAVRFEAQRDALRVEADEREKKLKDSFQKKIDAKNAELTQKEEELNQQREKNLAAFNRESKELDEKLAQINQQYRHLLAGTDGEASASDSKEKEKDKKDKRKSLLGGGSLLRPKKA